MDCHPGTVPYGPQFLWCWTVANIIISTFIVSAGDYAILIQAGIHWFTALLFNFVSSLTAIVGMFIGVAISQNSGTANEWILAITAGLFLYIGLTDLVRMTMNKQMNIVKNKRWMTKTT